MKEWGENHQNDAVFFTNSGKDPFIILVQPFSSTTPKTIKNLTLLRFFFHLRREFGESSTDSDGSSSSGGPSKDDTKKIARKKSGSVKKKKVPDYQRFHA